MEAATQVRRSRVALIVLTVTTACLHFERAAADPHIRVLFILNGLGYLTLVTAFYLPAFQTLRAFIRWMLIAYTGVTIALYFVWVAMSGDWTFPIGPAAKIVELAMIVLLLRAP
jgi:hypothetical protein